MVHELHWQRLASLSSEEVCRRSGAELETVTGCYLLPLLNQRLAIDPRRRAVEWHGDSQGEQRGAGLHVALLAVVYLLEAREALPLGEWATAESLPAGAFFFRGPHAIPTAELARRYGSDPDGFQKAGVKLGGAAVEGGSACVQLQALPRVPARLVLWQGDEEFPAQVTMLFDRLVDQHLPMDALLSLARHLAQAMLHAAQESA